MKNRYPRTITELRMRSSCSRWLLRNTGLSIRQTERRPAMEFSTTSGTKKTEQLWMGSGSRHPRKGTHRSEDFLAPSRKRPNSSRTGHPCTPKFPAPLRQCSAANLTPTSSSGKSAQMTKSPTLMITKSISLWKSKVLRRGRRRSLLGPPTILCGTMNRGSSLWIRTRISRKHRQQIFKNPEPLG